MTREKLAAVIAGNRAVEHDTVFPSDYDLADRLLETIADWLPVKELEMEERRNAYWGGKDGYQVAHTRGDMFRVRFHGKVICKNIKGFSRAVKWANAHHRSAILSSIATTDEGA